MARTAQASTGGRPPTSPDRPPGSASPEARRTGGLRPALLLLAVFALAFGTLQLAAGTVAPVPYWVPLAFTLVYSIWAAAGIIAWWRRPLSATGGLLLRWAGAPR